MNWEPIRDAGAVYQMAVEAVGEMDCVDNDCSELNEVGNDGDDVQV